jgi:glycosyltransferase involved in cell wall biosynthesis
VVTSKDPFVYGGNEILAENLTKKLLEYGYESDLMYTPKNRFGRYIRGYLANRLIDMSIGGDGKKIDQIISLKFPSYAIKHPIHILWLTHRIREYYDLWDIMYRNLSNYKDRLKESIRRVIYHSIDGYLIKNNIKKVYSISNNVANRLKKWGNIDSEILYPPPRDELNYICRGYEDYIFSTSRLTRLKRYDLLIRAFKFVKNKDAKCYISGEGEDRDYLNSIIEKEGLKDRVFLLGYLDNNKLSEYYSRCRGVFFGPYNEDYGFITIEGMKFKKPVITLKDSGAPLEFVKHGINGFISEPDPVSIAENLNILFDNDKLVYSMGEYAYNSIKDITWDRVLERLVMV